MPVRELRRHRLPENYASRRARERHARSISSRTISAVDRGAVLGWQVGGIDDVFHTEGHTSDKSGTVAAVSVPRFAQRRFCIEVAPCLDNRLAVSDALET